VGIAWGVAVTNGVAEAIDRNFSSPNEADSGFESGNVADGLFEIARAVRSLLYGLKYGKEEGLSIAEAIEVGLRAAGEAIAIGIRDGAETIAEALSEVKQ
jgi:hypothetical protein